MLFFHEVGVDESESMLFCRSREARGSRGTFPAALLGVAAAPAAREGLAAASFLFSAPRVWKASTQEMRVSEGEEGVCWVLQKNEFIR